MRMFSWVLPLVICLSTLLSAQDQDFSKVQMKVTHVAGTVYMLDG